MGYKIYGTPWTPDLGGWGFSAQRGEDILKHWKKIPSDTDILLTHGPPYGIFDNKIHTGGSVGCEDLLNEVQKRIKPMYHLFGHVHEGYGQKKIGETTFINAASVNFMYRAVNKPVVFYLDQRET